MFLNSYENKEIDGKKNFMSLWLHAYKYTVPAEIHSDDKEEGSLVIKSAKPQWALPDYKVKQTKLE